MSVQQVAPALDHSIPSWSAYEVSGESAFDETQLPFQARDETMFTFYEESVPAGSNGSVKATSSAFSKNGSSWNREELSEAFEHTVSTSDHSYLDPDDTNSIGQPAAFADVAGAHTGADLVERLRQDFSSIREETIPTFGEEAVRNPMEPSLQNWDYSQNEWPVLVGPQQPKPSKRLGFAIAALVLLGAAAGLYLIYRPSAPVQRSATDSGTIAKGSTGEPRTGSAAPADSRGQAQPASTAAATPVSSPAESSGPEAAAANGNSAQGRFSLQAAAFPTQGGAEEFAERLKRSGVPSYVVTTDLARRGRWFRVRVGRFNSAEDAQRFAGEAQQRAKAGGLAVQLIVCQYDQP
jgi:cell division septation protein DedD